MADSEALRLKYSNSDIYDKYKPGGEISQKLYKIAEKISCLLYTSDAADE